MYFNIILWCFRMVPSSPCLHSCGLKDIISHLFLGLLSFPWYLVSAFPPLSTWVNVQLWCRLSATALQCPRVRISQWMLLEEWGEVLIFRNSTELSEVPKPFMKTHTFALFINLWLVSPILAEGEFMISEKEWAMLMESPVFSLSAIKHIRSRFSLPLMWFIHFLENKWQSREYLLLQTGIILLSQGLINELLTRNELYWIPFSFILYGGCGDNVEA